MASTSGPVLAMQTQVGYTFFAAHLEFGHDALRPMHGHTYEMRVELAGRPGAWSLEHTSGVDLAIRKIIAPLRARTFLPQNPAIGRCLAGEREVRVEVGDVGYTLPRAHVVLLPLSNTTADVLAGYLLGRLVDELADLGTRVELALTLAPDPQHSITVRSTLEPLEKARAPQSPGSGSPA